MVTAESTRAYSWYALALLTIVSLLNYRDRTLSYILFTPIKQEMSFSDFELALLGTTSFVIFFTALGVPFGRLADRSSRKNMIAAGLAVWSLFSGLTGFANGFWSLFFCRVMVGVGEATLGPAALSLLSDYFPPRMRASVQSVYASGITIGAGYLSKAIELTSRADLADDVQPWFESSTTPPGPCFVDVFSEIRAALPLSVLGVLGEQAGGAQT